MTVKAEIEKIQSEHWLKGNSLNLGQYKAEYTCACGDKFIEDGHSQDPFKASIRLIMQRHVATQILKLIEERLPPNKKPERGLQTEPCDRDKCGMCNRVKGYNAALTEVKSLLRGDE